MQPRRLARSSFPALELLLSSALLFGLAACSSQDAVPSSSASPSALGQSSATKASIDQSASLVFKRMGTEVKRLTLAEILAKIPAETIKQFDPEYNREKTFRAVPFSRVLDLAFEAVDLPKQEYVLRAKDGYTVPMRGSLALEQGAYLAFEDTEVPGWEPVGERRENPGPFYLIWAKKEQTSLETHPRPYQLVSIEIAKFEDLFPKTVPTGIAEGAPARRGFETFREQCILCHAINREGGRVGPELNVPQSIVEYRPVDQVKAYIKNPLTFRYSQMPPHPTLSDEDLDDLVAYFTAMKGRKQDSDAAASPPPSASASAAPSSAPSSSAAVPKARPPVPGSDVSKTPSMGLGSRN